MSPPEPPSDAAHTAPLAACSPQAPTCFGALRSLCGASTSAAAMSHQEAPPAPAPKHGESGAGAKDATGATSAEPLDPKARDALRSAFYEGATKSNINDVYALGSTIGAFFAATCSGACSLTSEPSGTGGFAVVLQAMHRASRAAVAVKVLSLSTARIVETGVRQLARCRYKSLTSCAGLGSCADDAHGCAFAAVWCCARCGRRGRDAGGASLEEHRPVRQQAR